MEWYKWIFGSSSDDPVCDPTQPEDTIAYSKRKPYVEIKSHLLSTGQLFHDAHFPARNTSLNFNKQPPLHIEWKRPHQIVQNPTFFVDGVSYDIYISNLWKWYNGLWLFPYGIRSNFRVYIKKQNKNFFHNSTLQTKIEI